MILSVLFLLIAMLTNVLTNNAAAVLFTPVAVNLAHQLGADVFPFALAVVFGASCSFATPIGYQTNLLVMGPGHYRFWTSWSPACRWCFCCGWRSRCSCPGTTGYDRMSIPRRPR